MNTLTACLIVLLALAAPAFAQPQMGGERRAGPPTLTVTGRSEVSARPDQAVVRLGAVAQAEQAAAAQQQVNSVVQAAIEKIKALGIPDESISTAGLSLDPVYSQPPPRPMGNEPYEPRIVGFRAHNTLRIEINDLTRVGPVIDAGVSSGVNQVEGLTFGLRDDTEVRARALKQAVASARTKARAIAEAMEIQLGGVHEITEGSPDGPIARMEYGMARMAADVGTPVQPGQVRVEAVVTVRFRIGGGDL